MIGLYIALVILGAFILFFLFPTMLISNVIYTRLFIRVNKELWSRNVSWDDKEQQQMFDEGKEWGNENESYRKTLEIDSCGFHLVGEYFDFGYDKAVIIIPGRMESGTYSYFFSVPYKKAGYNVLAIDNRSHGLSEGKYNCIGLKEYKDIIAWAKVLHDEHHIKSVIIHGLCIGSATGLYALTSKNCPDYIDCLVADGMYVNFHENLKNHLIERKKPVFPYTSEVMWMVSMVAHKSPKRMSPIKLIHKMNKPMLFIYSKEDKYCLEDKANELFDKCGSEKKQLSFFDHGVHSHVRINQKEQYDETIIKFLKDNLHE